MKLKEEQEDLDLQVLSKRFYIILIGLVFGLSLNSCGVRKTTTTPKEIISSLSPKEIISNHQATKKNFKTLSGRMKIELQLPNSSQSVPATFRMIKGEGIWISAFFGVAKALVTPSEISFYSSVNKIYFKGSFEELSRFVGTQLTYNALENLLLGEAVIELQAKKSQWSFADNVYRFKPKSTQRLFKLWLDIDPENFQLKNTIIAEEDGLANINVDYKSYQRVGPLLLPEQIQISATKESVDANLSIEYKNLLLNKELRFPFKIPSDYKAIDLN